MLYLKNIIFVLMIFCLYSSCLSGKSSQIQSNTSPEHLIVSKEPVAKVEQNTNTSNNSTENTQYNSDKIKINRPYQTKPRRQAIKFSVDCTDYIPAGEENWQLQTACADAIKSALSDLPKTSNIGLSSTKIDCDYNNIQNKDDWLNDYGANFYPLAPNKYLVEILCIAGAYNELNAYMFYDESKLPAQARVLEFPRFDIDHDEDSDVGKTIEKVMVKTVGGRYFNPKTKELIVFVKAHGIGDAGHYARYSFPNDKPKLEEFRARFVWSGREYTPDQVFKSPPKTWKRYYPK